MFPLHKQQRPRADGPHNYSLLPALHNSSMNFLAAIVTRQPIRRPSSMLSQDTVQGDILSFDPVSNRLTAINPLGPVETQIQELKKFPTKRNRRLRDRFFAGRRFKSST